jgi:hypothetical protein
VCDLYADGDTVITHFDGAATPKDGQPQPNSCAWFLHLRDGQIIRADAILDSISFNDLGQHITTPAMTPIPMPGRHAGAPTAPTVWPATLRPPRGIEGDRVDYSLQGCAVASARCCPSKRTGVT